MVLSVTVSRVTFGGTLLITVGDCRGHWAAMPLSLEVLP